MKRNIERKWLGFNDLTEKWRYIFIAIVAVPFVGYLIHGSWLLSYYVTR